MSLETLTKAYSETISVGSTSWVIQHNLGTSTPVVDVYSGGSPDEKILPATVVATDANTVTITWSSATTGRVYVV